MIVRIMFRNNYVGGDGWTYYPIEVEIADTCPVCGGKRGKPYNHSFHEDGDWFNVNRWDNPCGHVDTYESVYKESINSPTKTFAKS